VRWGPGDVTWRTELDGQGHSSPSIWNEKIFLTGARKTEDQQVERLVFCLDRNSGVVVWQQVASVGKAEVTHNMNGYASATCATDGERMVAFFGRGGIHTYDMHGKKLWSRDLGTFPGPWGTAASPIIVDDKIIQNCDAQGGSFLIALDKKTGETVWKTSRGQMPRGGWSTPLVIDAGSRRELILNGEYGVHGYDPDTGREYWFCKGFNGRGTPSPTFDRQQLFVVSAKPGDTFALRPGGSGDVADTHIVWHTSRNGGRTLSSPIVEGNYLLTVSMIGIGVCYDVLTGEEHWTARLDGQHTASPITSGGLVYLQNEAGTTLVIKPGKELDVVARNHIEPAEGEIFRSSLVPSEGQIFCRSNRTVYCIGKRATP
jgi:outer membrane protein assembly factor BamB